MKSTGMWRRDGKLVICGWHAWALKIRQAQIQQFKSDFRVVAEFFSQKRKQLDYTPSNQQLQHAKEVLQLFSIMTDDARFEDIYNEELEKGEGGVKTMCDVLDRAMEKGKLVWAYGRQENWKIGWLYVCIETCECRARK